MDNKIEESILNAVQLNLNSILNLSGYNLNHDNDNNTLIWRFGTKR